MGHSGLLPIHENELHAGNAVVGQHQFVEMDVHDVLAPDAKKVVLEGLNKQFLTEKTPVKMSFVSEI